MFSIPLFVAEWHTSFRLHKVVGEANLSKALLAHISEFVPAHDWNNSSISSSSRITGTCDTCDMDNASLLYPHFPSNGSPVVTYDQTSSTYFSGVSFFVYQTVQKYTPSNEISDKHTRTCPTVL